MVGSKACFPAISPISAPIGPDLTPDGRLVAVAVGRIDLEADQYRADLWLVPTAGRSAPPPLPRAGATCGRGSPTAAGWRPSCEPATTTSRLWVMATDGASRAGCASTRSGSRRSPGAPTRPGSPMSPGCPRRAATAPARTSRREGAAAADHHLPVPDRQPRLHLRPAPARVRGRRPGRGGRAVQVTRGDYDHADPAWSPDGAAVAFVSARHETRDEDAVSDVFVAPAAGGDAVRVTATDLSVARPAFSPDGATIWFVASEPDLAGRPNVLWSVPADGSRPSG